MSTIIIMQTARGAHLVTDAGEYSSEDGRLLNITSKTFMFQRQRAALAWRGQCGTWTDMVIDRLEELPTWGSMAAALPMIAADVLAIGTALSDDAPPAGGWHFELYLAGWHKRTASPECVFLSSRPDPETGTPAFQMRSMGFMVAPAVDVAKAIGRAITPATMATLDPARDGLALIEAQRREGDTVCGFGVAGGRAELTSVTKEGVTRTVLREWPDRIGEIVRRRPVLRLVA